MAAVMGEAAPRLNSVGMDDIKCGADFRYEVVGPELGSAVPANPSANGSRSCCT